MKKLIISLAGIIMLTGVFLIVSANNALRIPSNNVDIPQNQDNKNNKNILLLGYWGEFGEGREIQSDSVIVASLNSNNSEITFKSLPFVTYGRTAEILVNNAKIAAFQEYGQYIDYYATIDFTAFKEAIDLLGGIDVYVDESINDTQFPNDVSFSNGKIQYDRDPSRGYSPFNISAGQHHMDWETALKYVRSKKTTSEWDRQKRQQKVLQAALDKVLASGFDVSQLYNLYKIYNNKITTNISLSDATSIISVLKGSNVDLQRNANSTLGWNSEEYITKTNSTEGNEEILLSNGYTKEQNDAYKFGLSYGLISAQNIDTANLNGYITRAALAKMISKFAENVLGKSPSDSANCYFTDITQDVDNRYSNGITKSCKLGIMGISIQKFKPYDNVLRAEFGTILSRLVFGISDGIPYYQPHLNTLKANGIMNNIDPFKIEKRGNVLLMLMRTAQKIGIQDGNYSNNNRSDATSNKSSVSIRNSDKKTLLGIVELIDPTLVEEANNILTSANTDKHAAADGADMSLAKIRHFINTGNNIITLFWDYIPYSNDVEIRRFDPIAADYTVLGTVPMYQEYFQYQANDGDNEILFAFIPKNTKGREYRYDVALGSGNKDDVKKFKLSVEFVELKKKLGNTSVVLEKLIPTINSKSESVRKKIIETLETYADSNDSYTKEIGSYLVYLLK